MSSFDPAEFDRMPLGDAPDYRDILAAIREAAAAGTHRETLSLRQVIEQETTARERWLQQAGNSLQTVQNASQSLSGASRDWVFHSFVHVAIYATLATALMFIAATFYHWAKAPKIEEKLYGCTAAWDAKNKICKGKWIPLYPQ